MLSYGSVVAPAGLPGEENFRKPVIMGAGGGVLGLLVFQITSCFRGFV